VPEQSKCDELILVISCLKTYHPKIRLQLSNNPAHKQTDGQTNRDRYITFSTEVIDL